MADETLVVKRNSQRPADENTAKIQRTIASLSEMESQLDALGSSVSDVGKRLVANAESLAEKAKAEIIEQASRESEVALEAVRSSAKKEADQIVQKGLAETEALKKRIKAKISSAAEIIIQAVQSA